MSALLKEISFSRNGSFKFLLFLIAGTALFTLTIYYTLKKEPVAKKVLIQHEEQEIKESLTLHGSRTLGTRLAPELIEAWLRSRNIEDIETSKSQNITTINYYDRKGNKGLVTLVSAGSNIAFQGSKNYPNTGLLNQKCDIAMSTRQATTKELKKLEKSGLGMLTTHRTKNPIALDGIAILVHPSCGINEISLENLAKIYSGQIKNWSELGGMDVTISAFNRENTSGISHTFKKKVMKPNKQTINEMNGISRGATDLIKQLNVTQGSIGYASTSVKISNLKALDVKACEDCIQVSPNAVSIRAAEYPLTRILYFYSSEKRSHIAELFLNFIRTESAYQIAQNQGFMKAHGVFVNDDDGKAFKNSLYARQDASRKQRYIALHWDRSKTAVSLRFKENTYNLDERSDMYLMQIIALLHQEQYKNYKVMLVGHTCSSLGSEANDDAQRLIHKIKEVFWKNGLNAIIVHNEGTNMQIADPKSANGRRLNRRVNLWIKDKSESQE